MTKDCKLPGKIKNILNWRVKQIRDKCGVVWRKNGVADLGLRLPY